jgi:hypothetical protein
MRSRCKMLFYVPNVMLSATAPMISVWSCGSRSLFNIARMFGGNLPNERASLIASEVLEATPREIVLSFPGRHRLRKKALG